MHQHVTLYWPEKSDFAYVGKGHFKKRASKHKASKQQNPRKQWIFQEESLHHLRKCLYMDYISFRLFIVLWWKCDRKFLRKCWQMHSVLGNTFFFLKRLLFKIEMVNSVCQVSTRGMKNAMKFMQHESEKEVWLLRIYTTNGNWKISFGQLIFISPGILTNTYELN